MRGMHGRATDKNTWLLEGCGPVQFRLSAGPASLWFAWGDCNRRSSFRREQHTSSPCPFGFWPCPKRCTLSVPEVLHTESEYVQAAAGSFLLSVLWVGAGAFRLTISIRSRSFLFGELLAAGYGVLLWAAFWFSRWLQASSLQYLQIKHKIRFRFSYTLCKKKAHLYDLWPVIIMQDTKINDSYGYLLSLLLLFFSLNTKLFYNLHGINLKM